MPKALASVSAGLNPQGGGVRADRRFEFAGLRPGEYRVTALPPANRARYLPAHFGAATPYESGIAVRVTAGEIVERIDITLAVAGHRRPRRGRGG